MTVRVAINGFGRMGLLALRAAWGQHDMDADDFDIVHVNEPNADAATSAHLLAFDSVHGRWPIEARATEDGDLCLGDKILSYSSAPDLRDVDWRGLGIDLAVDCSGQFKTVAALQPYYDAGVGKVVVSAPIKEAGALNIVMGVNDHLYDPDRHHLVTAASCTTNCLAPVVKVINETFGIRHGVITTIHDVTNTQVVVDKPHKDLRRARSSLMNLIPTSTGSATAIGLIFPELQGKLDGLAVRVPLLNASLTDCVFEVSRGVTAAAVNAALAVAAKGALRGVLGFEDRPLVSTDYRGDTHSGIVDGLSTKVVDDTQVKLLVWYDNEIGYVHRLMELVGTVAKEMA